ncbi:FAD:protein FMN transferase [Candidatus Magnetaquicoccus inordinatus]|uniref:FAD:protein FMN transferase n=1 Tax=Candidatus Magnetaquicoccus inordinatus TaxID=2496818 RepID=UPI00102AC067|nr:FAD:protein FMN transferase [Candidatus Magnetaquicoccus inordinatus]
MKNLLKYLSVFTLLIVLFYIILPIFKHNNSSVFSKTQMLMGTLVTISIWGESSSKASDTVDKAFEEISRLEEILSWQRQGSEVNKINSDSRGTWIKISTDLGRVIEKGLLIEERTNGVFSIGLQKLTKIWGFSQDLQQDVPPSENIISDWITHYPSVNAVQLMKNQDSQYSISLLNEYVALDLGALGKGYAIDSAIEILLKNGIHNAIVNAGGDLRVIGTKGNEQWKIGLQNPRKSKEIISVSLLKNNLAMMTSGDYERFFVHNGIRYHHILNPKTGMPAWSGLTSVTVQGQNATLINGLSTALFILGKEKGLKMLENFIGTEALLIPETGNPVRTKNYIGDIFTTYNSN